MKNKYRALSQLRGRKGAQGGVNEVSNFLTNSAEKSVKIDIHCQMQLLEWNILTLG